MQIEDVFAGVTNAFAEEKQPPALPAAPPAAPPVQQAASPPAPLAVDDEEKAAPASKPTRPAGRRAVWLLHHPTEPYDEKDKEQKAQVDVLYAAALKTFNEDLAEWERVGGPKKRGRKQPSRAQPKKQKVEEQDADKPPPPENIAKLFSDLMQKMVETNRVMAEVSKMLAEKL